MSPIEHLKIDKAKLASVCRHYHVVELSVFGSVARGEAGDASDVDLLVSFERGARSRCSRSRRSSVGAGQDPCVVRSISSPRKGSSLRSAVTFSRKL
jgi:hypothetical protein